MKTSWLAWLLFTVCLVLLLGCGVTMSALRAINPNAATLQVHCRPWQIGENVNIFAARVSSEQVDHIVTDETPGELVDYARDASVFVEVKVSAPPENAQKMASEYGLVCQEYLATRSAPLEALREEEPCLADTNGASNSQFIGDVNKPRCNSGGGDAGNAGLAPATLPRIAVCARPPGITGAIWYGGPGIKADVKTQAERDAQVAKATVEFYLDSKAPPESVWHFGEKTTVRCPGKAPMPYAQWVAKNAGTPTQQSGTGASATAALPPTSTAPKTGSGPPSSTSSPTGQGPPLSIFEQIANNMSVAGALAQGNTSGDLKDPSGHRNGIPGGKNVGGFSFPLLQAGVATFEILNGLGVSVSPKKFIDIVHKASKKGQRTVLEAADKAALDAADELIKNHGRFEMAKGLEEMQTIMPYAMSEKFTLGLGNKYQAHKIFERQALKKWKGSDAGFEKLPSVILTEAEHKKVTQLLNNQWNQLLKKKGKDAQVTKAELREIYEKAYASYPHWLEIVEKQLR